ncbi:MAG: hypothetical protein KDK65_01875 [Chlamydiia bacterium]|nr:hypothetical protein [Chlamydiia bacterium]
MPLNEVARQLSPVVPVPRQWPWQWASDLLTAAYVRLTTSAEAFAKMDKKEVRKLSVRTIRWLNREQFGKIDPKKLDRLQTQHLLEWQQEVVRKRGFLKRFAIEQLSSVDGDLSLRQRLALLANGQKETALAKCDRIDLVYKYLKLGGKDKEIVQQIIQWNALNKKQQEALFSLAAAHEELLGDVVGNLQVDFFPKKMTHQQIIFALKKCPHYVNELKETDWIAQLPPAPKPEPWVVNVLEALPIDDYKIREPILNRYPNAAT